MDKILIIIPQKIPQNLIMRGFCRGFKANKFCVETCFEKEIKQGFLTGKKYKLLLSYGNFSAKSEEVKTFLKKNNTSKNLVYIADSKNGNCPFPKNSLIFCSDKYFNPKFKYLPLAISSRTYSKDFEGYKYSISFVQNPNFVKKVEILSYVVKTFGRNLAVFCSKKDFEASVKKMEKFLSPDDLVTYKYCYKGFLQDEREIAEVLNSSKINLNIIANFELSLNFHAFETLGAGGFLLTNNAWAANEFFDLARDLETYENVDDLIDKIKFYLKNIDFAQIIAQNGKSAIKQGNTFKDRVKIMLKYL